jgi:acyl-CoA thioester hydrolase
MGVVYHANYVNWFEIGRTELIREMGYPYRQIERLGLYLPVVDLTMKFRQPARYDDVIEVFTRIVEFSNATIRFESQVRRAEDVPDTVPVGPGGTSGFRALVGAAFAEIEPEGELLVSGTTRHVWLNRQWKPVRLDREAPDLYDLLRRSVEGETGQTQIRRGRSGV